MMEIFSNKSNEGELDMAPSKEDPVLVEANSTLREWHQIWVSLYLDHQTELFNSSGAILLELLEAREELLDLLQAPSLGIPPSPHDSIDRFQQISELRTNIVNKIDFGNRLLGLDLVLRDADFKPVDPIKLSPIRLYQLHAEAVANQEAATAQTAATAVTASDHANSAYYLTNGYQDSLASTTGSSYYSYSQTGSDCQFPSGCYQDQNSHHLQLFLKQHQLVSLPPDELIEINFSIVDVDSTSGASSNIVTPITEKFLIRIKDDELVDGYPKTVFTNIGQVKGKDLGLLVQVYRVGRMILADTTKSSFGKQHSSSNMPLSIYTDLSTSSSTSLKWQDLPRSRHSTIGGLFNLQPNYRRPFGATYLSLTNQSKGSGLGREFNINSKIVMTQNESEFSLINELFSGKKTQVKSNQNLPYIQLDLSLRFLMGPLEAIPRITAFKCDEYCLTEKRGFPDVVMPGDFKNDLYLTLESAEFEKGGKSISKNIEASISLIDRSGLVIDKCIMPASNCDKASSYNSCIFYHSNSPRWNEGIKINVPLVEFDKAHIRIEFRHCSTKDRDKKFLGFSFLPLSDEDGTVIPDNTHELYLYKCDPQSWDEDSMNLRKYTSLPYGPGSKQASKSSNSIINNNNNTLGFGGSKVNLSNSIFSHSAREAVTVSTFLLSTKLTQNSTLLNLLKWRELVKRNNQDFEDTLNKVLTLKGEEIVKFLQDILDTLFDTFTLYLTSENNCSSLIFKVLLHIFLLLDDPKYQHFRPVLDTYASAHFSATLVYKGLLACVKKCLEYSSVVEKHAPIQKCFKSIKYVFQFIVQSRILYSKATGEQNEEHFLNDLRHLFRLCDEMLENEDKKMIPLQETFLESFPGALEQLIRVMDPMELARVVTSLAGSAGFHLPPQLSKAKLVFMRETANSSLLTNQNVRMHISDIFCCHLNICISNSERLELCHDVLEKLIVKVHDNHWPSVLRLYNLTLNSQTPEGEKIDQGIVISIGEINIYSKSGKIQANQLDLALNNVAKELSPFVKLMDPLLRLLDRLVRDLNNDRPIIQRYCNCLLTILKLMGKISFEQFTSGHHLDYLALCNLFKSLRAVYYREWSIMQLTSHAILGHPIDEISKIEFSRQPSPYIHLIVDFITHPTLQLEAFSERKKYYIVSVFGDLRLKFSAQLMKFWKNLTPAQICDLIPNSMQSFLDATLLPNDELQRRLIPVFYEMIDSDFRVKSNFKQIERCLIDHLDLFMNLDRGSKRFIQNFETILKDSIEASQPAFRVPGLKLVISLTRLMNLLIAYRQSLNDLDGESRQMVCLVDLLSFYRDHDRMDIYLKYLFKLCDIHLESGRHTEAAFALKLYADELRWCNRNLSSLEGFRPDEQEWRRKEVLYQRIIHYFDLGKCWEESISLCKELASFYENFLVDYEKVSSTLKKLAQLLDNILTEHRPEREYFRVEFMGSDQPDFVRGKELIYRGCEYERLAAFIQRITSEFPDARVLNVKERKQLLGSDKDGPNWKGTEPSGQYLVISNVKPMPFLQDTFKSGQRIINDKIIQYYLNNRLDTFSYDLPIVKGNGDSKDKPNGAEVNMRNLWVGRCILKLKKHLPSILPWGEVVSQEYIEISPVTNAIETISCMNVELSKLILSYTKEPGKQLSPLTMRLQGVLEAAVNGGPAVIVNAFFKRPPQDQELDQNSTPSQESLIKLRSLIRQQFTLLETGLGLHSRLAPPEVMPLHARLVERLDVLKKSLLEETSQIENNYETVTYNSRHVEAQNTISSSTTTPVTADLSSCSSSGMDEVDGTAAHNGGHHHHDSNGNVCHADSEDPVYSQPIEAKGDQQRSMMKHKEGAKGEALGSPSQQLNSGSSSLSTLAILGNMPLNHRSRISMTPNKELNATLYRGASGAAHLESTEFRSKAARRLTYDSSRLSADLMKSCTLDIRRAPPPANGAQRSSQMPMMTGNGPESTPTGPMTTSSASQQVAPPLPPRTFSQDKHAKMGIQGAAAIKSCYQKESPTLPKKNLSQAPEFVLPVQQRATRATNNRL